MTEYLLNRWLFMNPALSADEQSTAVCSLITTYRDIHSEVIVITDEDNYISRLPGVWDLRGEKFAKSNRCRVTVRGPSVQGVKGVLPSMLVLDGFSPSQDLLRELPEIIQRDTFLVVANIMPHCLLLDDEHDDVGDAL